MLVVHNHIHMQTQIAKLTQLRSLDLTRHGARAYNNKMTNKGMEALCSLPHLQSLVLHGYARLKNTTAMMLWYVCLVCCCVGHGCGRDGVFLLGGIPGSCVCGGVVLSVHLPLCGC